ncbi:MAG: hypothetical protein OXS28_05300 [Gammaproteobacteria bacterium]|nr:hypothetical protein [Gammaproteobacteria bacterium]
MSMELIAIISASIALAGLILNSQRTQRAEMQAQRKEMQAESKAMRAEMQAESKAMRAEMQAEFKTTREAIGELRERMAHLGRVDGRTA